LLVALWVWVLLFVQGGARAHADGVPYSANVPNNSSKSKSTPQ
jgi:hypothetical protein